MIRFLTAFFPAYLKRGIPGVGFHHQALCSSACTVPLWLCVQHRGTQWPAALQCSQGYLALLELITPVTTPRAGFHPVLNCTQAFKQIHNRRGIWQKQSSVGMGSCLPADLEQRVWAGLWKGYFGCQQKGSKTPLS